MTCAVYYNEFDPFAAQWLRNLIAARHLPAGEVDERSIVDVPADDLKGFRQAHFFAGIGGWPLALRLAGWPEDREVWTGSCPCQPLSGAGLRKGHADERHLWPAFYRLIAERKPAIVFGEQVTGKDGREWLSAVRADLEASGYAVGAADLCAAMQGYPHIRGRLYWVCSDANCNGPQIRPLKREFAGKGFRTEELERLVQSEIRLSVPTGKFGALAYGVPGRVGRLRAYGNAIVPQVAQAFIEAVMECAP